ncbi:Protein msta, isoform A [Orchesella cincta]|uniref:Protein msta, isoform A n=1 Tax=Orchesella cincta TaxID=48709 RepID=A0A1D2NA29_ORCCI|nr:Protein msta, isoform A [Orchesella cincta]
MGGDNYPITLKTDNVMGRYYVASRGIEPGELILQDDPIIVSPNTPTDSASVTCVGCCGVSQTSLPCGKCGWPVCKQECADIPEHADFECKIFARQQIKTPLPSPYCFIAEAEYIKVLRCLLLRELGKDDPEKLERWNMLQELEAHIELRKTIPKLMFMSKLIRNFIHDVCNLTEFDENTIDHVLGAIDVNAFKNVTNPMLPPGTYGATNVHINASVMYRKGSIVAHGCRRNTQSLTFPNGKLEMRAGEFIPEQEPLTHAYVDLMLGTPERRKILKTEFYFECNCSRCADPTELGTYFSALKCTQCPSGFLTMDNPLDFCPYWKCNKCPEIQQTEYETELLAELREEEKKILKSGRKNNAMIGSWIELLEKYSEKLHENHYALLQIQLHLIRCMAKVTKPPAELVEDMHKLVNKYKKLYRTFYPCMDDDQE